MSSATHVAEDSPLARLLTALHCTYELEIVKRRVVGTVTVLAGSSDQPERHVSLDCDNDCRAVIQQVVGQCVGDMEAANKVYAVRSASVSMRMPDGGSHECFKMWYLIKVAYWR